MIKIYMDWNVMSQMKAGKHSEFAEIIADNKKFYKLYSTSHIGDIAASSNALENKQNIDTDLEFISELTGNQCVFNTGKEVVIEHRSPHELFDERTDLGGILDLLNLGNEDVTLTPEDDEIRKLILPALEHLKHQPSDEVFKAAFENPDSANQMRQFLPDLENNYTSAGVFNSILNMFKRLNEKEDYKQLRNIVQRGAKINRDRLHDTLDPYKMIEKAYSKLGVVVPDTPLSNEYAPQWFNELTNEYIKLDMHGYQEDQVKIDKGKKQTFRNTTEDAFHTAFATTCDFYITNDGRNRKKAEVIYEKLKINSLVMTTEEFVAHYKNWLHFKGEKFLSFIPAILHYVEPEISENGLHRTYFGCFFVFDYFNKMLLIQNEDAAKKPFFMLTRQKPTHNTFLYRNEIEVLVDKLLAIFGKDLEELNSIQDADQDQIRADEWPGRKWIYLGMHYYLRIVTGRLQLYISFMNAEENTESASL